MVSPLIITNVVYTIVDSFVDSDVVEKAYDMAFVNFDWGVSVAMSLLSFRDRHRIAGHCM